MKSFKKICLLGFLGLLPSCISNSYFVDSIEKDIVRRYQQEVLSNARYNNYKDSRRKVLQHDIDNLKIEIDNCNYRISECNGRINDLDYRITLCKDKRTRLDGELAELMCLDDLGDPTAKTRMLTLKIEISRNEDTIKSYESQKSSYSLKKAEYLSRKENLEYKLRQKQRELNSL